jgi:hypothetical protein
MIWMCKVCKGKESAWSLPGEEEVILYCNECKEERPFERWKHGPSKEAETEDVFLIE